MNRNKEIEYPKDSEMENSLREYYLEYPQDAISEISRCMGELKKFEHDIKGGYPVPGEEITLRKERIKYLKKLLKKAGLFGKVEFLFL